MTAIFRVVISAIVIVATFYFFYWTALAFIPIPVGVAAVLSYAGAMAAGWYAWTRTASVNSSLSRSVGYWAMVVGAIGFIGGFFGPMVFAPGANQGPLLGHPHHGPRRRADRCHWRAGALAGPAKAEWIQCRNVT